MSATPDLDSLRLQWTEAERKMYPLATVSPEKYQQLVRLAREVADGLVDVKSSTGLAKKWSKAAALVDKAAVRISVPVGDLPAESVAGVGFALRDAELRAVAHQQEMIDLIAAARKREDAWVLLHETGNIAHGLMAPYSAIELHLDTGAAVVSSVEPNPVDGSVNHVLTVIRMDGTTGEPVDIDPGIAETEEYRDADSFIRGREALVARLTR